MQFSDACLNKMTYRSETMARVAAMEARAASGHKNIKPYTCKECKLWHIGHSYDD